MSNKVNLKPITNKNDVTISNKIDKTYSVNDQKYNKIAKQKYLQNKMSLSL